MKISYLKTISDNMWENANRTFSLYLLIKDLTTTSRNNVQQEAKIKELITIIVASLFPNSSSVFS